MWPDQVWNPGPLTYESGGLTTVLRGLAQQDLSVQDIPPIHAGPYELYLKTLN